MIFRGLRGFPKGKPRAYQLRLFHVIISVYGTYHRDL
jgi:hypothetical protein